MDYIAEAERRLARFREPLRERDEEIRACRRDGIPVPYIAQALGLTRQHIYDILNSSRENRAHPLP